MAPPRVVSHGGPAGVHTSAWLRMHRAGLCFTGYVMLHWSHLGLIFLLTKMTGLSEIFRLDLDALFTDSTPML